ncbi:MAG: response regulator [Bacteroidales bacterium]|nr:response regulator [Bacteroidales bacterium]
MKRLTLLTVIILSLILLINFFYYNNLYNKQIDYVKDLLGQQIAIIGSEVYTTNIEFEKDINNIILEEELADLFNEELPGVKELVIEKLKFYYGKYDNFVETIEYNGPEAQIFILYKDLETDAWIANTYMAQDKTELLESDRLEPNRNKWDLIKPVYSSEDELAGNIIITVDYIKYFSSLFRKYKIEEQQWQWLIDEEGNVVFSNYYDDDISNRANLDDIVVRNLNRINDDIRQGINGNTEHSIEVKGDSRRVISSYYAVELLRQNFGMVFSAPGDFYQIYLIRNSLLIVSLTIVLISFLILLYRRFIKSQAYSANRLSESEQSFVRMIELMPVGIVVTNRNNEVIKANESAATMFNFPDTREMEGKLMPETEPSGKGVFFAEALGADYEAGDFMMINKQGVDTVLYRKKIPVAFKGEEASMIVLMDVTLLEMAHKQESKARELKSEFISRISHEIRTPLNGIIGMADILSRKDNDPESQKVINLIKNSSDQLMEIINDMLDFSKIEERSLRLDAIPFDLKKEIEYCFNVAGTSAGEDVSLTWELSEEVPERVIGDPFRFRQIFTHLLNTSLEHTDKGEIKLTVHAEDETDGEVLLKFDLRDTGRDYDSNMLKKMFGEYLNAETGSPQNYGSKGLGAQIARQLIEMMEGHLKPSTPSGISDRDDAPGARFEFSLRVYSDARTQKEYGAASVRQYKDIRTLLISGLRERDENLLNALHKIGLATYVTSWQKQTVNLIKSNLEHVDERYRLIIILDTPDFDGFEVAQTLYGNGLHTELLILMLSSNDKRDNYVRCIKYGIDEYIVKPYNISELLNILKERFPALKPETEKDLSDEIKKDLKVLVVEDNLISQKVAVTILKNLGLATDIAGDGKEGVEKALAKDYDIVFMDLIMPEMNGYMAAKKILEHSPGTLIIALTADSTSESAEKAEIAGIGDFITKPVRQEDVKNILVKYFSR